MDEKTFNKIPDQERANSFLEGIIYYAHVQAPTDPEKNGAKFKGDPYFSVTLGLDVKAQLDKAKAFGLKIKEPTEKIPHPHVDLKRKVKAGKTAEEVRPYLVDPDQNDLPRDVLVGNGSRGICKFARYWYDNNGGGVGGTLLKTMILDFVPYGVDEGFGDVKGSFSVNDLKSVDSEDDFQKLINSSDSTEGFDD